MDRLALNRINNKFLINIDIDKITSNDIIRSVEESDLSKGFFFGGIEDRNYFNDIRNTIYYVDNKLRRMWQYDPISIVKQRDNIFTTSTCIFCREVKWFDYEEVAQAYTCDCR